MLPASETRCLTPRRNSGDVPTPSRGYPIDHRLGTNIGNLAIREQIGGGGMGAVYEAHHQHLDRRVAIKFLRNDGTASAEANSRFEREYRSLAQIDHPNVLRALDAGEWNGQRYVVTELLQGLDLQRYVEQFGPVDPIKTMEWIRQAALGLFAAHELGLIHRDVKPSNLFLSQNSTIKLIDFGIVRRSQPDATSTQDGQFLGTVDYLSPEQATSPNNVDAACDIYSLGCVWIFLLSGKPPFMDSHYPGFMTKVKGHMVDLPPWLSSSEANRLPKPVRTLLFSMIAKDPAKRPSSAEEVAQRIDAMATKNKPSLDPRAYRAAALFTVAACIGSLTFAIASFPSASNQSKATLSTEETPTRGVQTVRSQVRSVKTKPHSSKPTWSGFPHSSRPESPE
jgi:serine/threonine protein kinase